MCVSLCVCKRFSRIPTCTAPLSPADQPTQPVREWASIFLLSVDLEVNTTLSLCVCAVICFACLFLCVLRSCVCVCTCVSTSSTCSYVSQESSLCLWSAAPLIFPGERRHYNGFPWPQARALTPFTASVCVYVCVHMYLCLCARIITAFHDLQPGPSSAACLAALV